MALFICIITVIVIMTITVIMTIIFIFCCTNIIIYIIATTPVISKIITVYSPPTPSQYSLFFVAVFSSRLLYELVIKIMT